MKLKIRLSFLGVLFLFVWLSAAYSTQLEDKVVEHTFKNGMKLLMVERHIAPTVALYIRLKVGSVDEVSGKTGIAHMLEHMLFKGTKTIGTRDFEKEKPVLDKIDSIALEIDEENRKPDDKKDKEKIARLKGEIEVLNKEHKKYVVTEGASTIYAENGGVGYNAFTGNDGTTYVISLPSNKLELWANVESDRILNPVLREYYSERDVIMEERRRSIDSDPWGVLYEQFLAAAFTSHPYGNPIIGWMEDIGKLSKKDTEDFLKRYYSPNNMILAIVGDINPNEVISLIGRYFDPIPPSEIPYSHITEEPAQLGERRISVEWDAEPGVMIGFHKPTLPDNDDDIFDAIDSILSSGRTSRLYKRIVEEKQIAASVETFSAPGSRYPNLFAISATPRFPHTVSEVEQAIYEELDILKNEPVSPDELQKIKNQIDANLIRGLSSNSGLAGKLASYEALAGSWRYILQNMERIKNVTAEDIMRVAKKYLNRENRTVAVMIKKGS